MLSAPKTEKPNYDTKNTKYLHQNLLWSYQYYICNICDMSNDTLVTEGSKSDISSK